MTHIDVQQIEKANAVERTPVVFVHGLWLLPSSWDRWAAHFEQAGYAVVVDSSHVVMISHPDLVTKVIKSAAAATG
jgi:hypothetical protein